MTLGPVRVMGVGVVLRPCVEEVGSMYILASICACVL